MAMLVITRWYTVSGLPSMLKIRGHHGANRVRRLWMGHLQGGTPSYVCWFIIPMNYRYNPPINPSEIGLINQLS